MRAISVTARTLVSSAAIEGVAAEWRALEAATPEATGFQSAAWRLCCERGAASPRVVTVRENGRLVMLLPLQVHALWGATVVCWLGEPLAQYGDALALPDPRRPFWYSAAEAEMARWKDVDLVALTRLRADGVIASCGARLVMAGAKKNAAPYIDLSPAPSVAGLRETSLRRHKSVERRTRKLADYGPLRLESAQGAGARREAAEQALAFKREWLRRRRRFSAALSDLDVGLNLLALAEKGALRAHRLWAGDKLVSVELGLRSGTSYRSLIGAYDDDLAAASPGHALTLRLLPALAAEGVTRFDFLPPADPFKLLFATGADAMAAVYTPLNWRGVLAGFALARLRPLVKSVTHALNDNGFALEPVARLFAAAAPRHIQKSESESLGALARFRRS